MDIDLGVFYFILLINLFCTKFWFDVFIHSFFYNQPAFVCRVSQEGFSY